MKTFLAVAAAVILIVLLAIYLDRSGREPIIPKFVPAQRAAKPHSARSPAPRYPFVIEGEISKRLLLHSSLPKYPEWAQEKGIGGIYKVRVKLNPAGELKSFMQPLQTTGHLELDEAAQEALRKWKFNAVPAVVGDQDGTIAFHFHIMGDGSKDLRPGASEPRQLTTQPSAPPLGGRDRLAIAERYEDLGPDTIDVSRYPEYQKTNYQIFLQRCSRCHTPARAINTPIVSEKEWTYYVGLMHTWSAKMWLKGDERKWIVDFLTYDAQQRKVDHREDFLKEQQKLQQEFRNIRPPTP